MQPDSVHHRTIYPYIPTHLAIWIAFVLVCVCMWAYRLMSFVFGKGPSLEIFSTCHLARHQLNSTQSQVKPTAVAFAVASDLVRMSGPLFDPLPPIPPPPLIFPIFSPPSLAFVAACEGGRGDGGEDLSNIVLFPYAFHLSILCLYFVSISFHPSHPSPPSNFPSFCVLFPPPDSLNFSSSCDEGSRRLCLDRVRHFWVFGLTNFVLRLPWKFV